MQGSTESAMSGSESKTERETGDSSPSETNRPSLADFLAPPRPRASAPPPARDVAGSSETSAPPEETAAPKAAASTVDVSISAAEAAAPVAEAATPAEEPATPTAEAETPTEPTTMSDVPPRAAVAAPPTESLLSEGPTASSDAAARSLIPVATSADSDPPPDEPDDFEVPGAARPLSGATVRRVTFVALLAAAAAVPAWVVFRARSVDMQARAEASTPKVSAASAGPSTLAPAREIEADDDEPTPSEPPVAAVPIDPAKALEARREARRLLEGGQIEPGVAAARNAIALNPADPESYVLLAAGLQDMGRWAESRDVFSRCIHKSKDGINAECAYFANSGTITNR
jgi:hypothetical protein